MKRSICARTAAMTFGMAVAGVEHGDAAGEIDVALALDVPELGVLGALGEDPGRMADAAGTAACWCSSHVLLTGSLDPFAIAVVPWASWGRGFKPPAKSVRATGSRGRAGSRKDAPLLRA